MSDEPKKEEVLDCQDGNGQAKPHYWHWLLGSEFKKRECSTCGKVEESK